MGTEDFNKIMYDLGTTYSGYRRTRWLLEKGELGEYNDLDSLVMSYVAQKNEMERLTMQLCEEFGKKT